MNQFEISVLRSIQRHGIACTYKSTTQGTYDPLTDSVNNTEVQSQIKAYKKNVTVTQYNYPNLIGKEVSEFYIPFSSVNKPKPEDKILVGSETYVVLSNKEHAANQAVLLHIILAVKL